VGRGLRELLFSGFCDLNSPGTFPLIGMAILSLLEALVGRGLRELLFSGFGDLNFPGTFPLIGMAILSLLEALVGARSPGAPFCRFWGPELPRYIPPYRNGYFEPFGGPCGVDSSADFKA
jgi:hypothetical protein